MTTDEVDVRPTPVVGNASPGHVMTNGDGVTADGVVGVLLEQPTANAATTTMNARANTAVVDCRNSRARDCVTYSCRLCGDYVVRCGGRRERRDGFNAE